MKKKIVQGIFVLPIGIGILIFTPLLIHAQALEVSNWVKKAKEFFHSGDHAQAMKWYQKAAVQGNADAEFWVGYLYANPGQ